MGKYTKQVVGTYDNCINKAIKAIEQAAEFVNGSTEAIKRGKAIMDVFDRVLVIMSDCDEVDIKKGGR